MTSTERASHRVVSDDDGSLVLVKTAHHRDGRDRLAAEAAVLRALDHPGLVRVVAFRDDGAGAELHLAWVGSHSLATVTGLPLAVVAEVVAGAAATVADLHDVGVSHRRLSPDHVLLHGNRPVLTGLAEADHGDGHAPADDVAALGALLTRLVAPRPEPALVPDRRWPRLRGDRGLRRALLTLADHAQADDPGARPDARALADALRAVLGPDPGASPGRLARHPARTRRNPARTPGSPQDLHAGGRRARLLLVPAGATAAAAVVAVALAGSHGPPASPPGHPAGGAVPPPSPAADPGPTVPPDDGDRPGPRPPAPTGPDRRDDPLGPTVSSVAPDAAPVPPPGPGDPPRIGDGPPSFRVDSRRVTDGTTTWVAGRDGDRVEVGDWDCDGIATPALLRPSTGEVFVFPRWPTADEEVTVTPAGRVPGAVDLDPRPTGEGCAALVVRRADGTTTAVPGTGGPP